MSLIGNDVFGPMTPKVDVELLLPHQAAFAQNARITSGALQPWKSPGAVPGVTLPGAAPIRTIYRFGKDSSSKQNYWFQWTGDVNVVKGPVNTDTEERTYWTDGTYPKKTKSTLAGLTAGQGITPASLRLGVPCPGWAGENVALTYTPVATVSGSATDSSSAPITSVYVVTYVTSWGEESKPSNPSNQVTWRAGQTVSVTLPGVLAGAYSLSSVNLYRSNTGSSRTSYQFCGTAPATAGTYNDTATPASLGAVVGTWDFDVPSDGMIGLTDMGNGVLAAFEKNTVSFCEPNYPYAWPAKYDTPLSAPIIGLQAFDSTLVVGTTDGLTLLSGSDPAQMVPFTPKGSQACVSKRSMVGMLGGVVYASPDGLILVSAGGAKNLTESILSREEWQAYAPASMDGYCIDDRYHCFYDNGTTKGGIIFTFGEDAGFVLTDQYATAGYSEARTDSLFLVAYSNPTNTLVEWNTGSPMTATWRSRDNRFYSGVAMSCARVVANAYPVTFKLFSDGSMWSTSVASAAPFRLPSGRASTIAYQVETTVAVKSVKVATSIKEMGDGNF